MIRCMTSGIVIAAVCCVFQAAAQDKKPDLPVPMDRGGKPVKTGGLGPGRGPGGERARELLEQVFLARISRQLELTDEQTVLMVRRYAEHREQLQKSRERRNTLAANLRKRLEQDKDSPEVAELLQQLEQADRDIANARFAIYEQLAAELTPQQRASLYLLIADFEEELRGWVQQIQRRRFGGAPESFPPEGMGPGPAPDPGAGAPMRGQGRRPGLRGVGRGPVPPAMPAMPAAPSRPRVQEPPPPPPPEQ